MILRAFLNPIVVRVAHEKLVVRDCEAFGQVKTACAHVHTARAKNALRLRSLARQQFCARTPGSHTSHSPQARCRLCLAVLAGAWYRATHEAYMRQACAHRHAGSYRPSCPCAQMRRPTTCCSRRVPVAVIGDDEQPCVVQCEALGAVELLLPSTVRTYLSDDAAIGVHNLQHGVMRRRRRKCTVR
eukprot:4211012-Prymnesium_polylepis.1